MNWTQRLLLLSIFCVIFSSQNWVFSQTPSPGWSFFNPGLGSRSTVLRDLDGNTIHTWTSQFGVGAAVYLLDNGRVLRCANDASIRNFGGAGVGGRLEIINWDGTVEWSYVASGPNYTQHHDAEVLPNGNILTIVWERYTRSEAIAMGRDPANTPSEVWSETILEIEPVGKTSGNIVWEWKVWDHLIQDFDPSLPNFGAPEDHPERIDINYVETGGTDWIHLNTVDYNPELDQIAIGGTKFDEVWIISHNPDDNGDIIYRYGNPNAYGRGTNADRQLWGQHHIQWIEPGLPGEGNIILFNNGADDISPRGNSSVDVFTPPLLPDSNNYELITGEPYGPLVPAFSLDSNDGNDFLSTIMSGVQQLPNGNLLICLGRSGEMFELDPNGVQVWEDVAAAFTFRADRIPTYDERLKTFVWDSGLVEVLRIITGLQISGGIAEVLEDDDQYLDVRRVSGPITTEVDLMVPDDAPSQLQVSVQAKHSLPAGTRSPSVQVTRQLELFNFQTQMFETVTSEISTLTDSDMVFSTDQDAMRFVEAATGTVRVRIQHEKTGLARGYRVLIDLVEAKIVF